MPEEGSSDKASGWRGFAASARVWRLIGFFLLLGYGVFLAKYFTPVAAGSDSSGYMNSARLLVEGRLTGDVRTIPGMQWESPYALTPLGFVQSPDGQQLIPTYPTGVPLQYAAAELLVGRINGVYLIGLGGALAAIVLCYLIGRRLGLTRAFAIVAAGLLAVNPVYIFIAIVPLSDVLAATWCLAAIWCLLRAREGLGWAAAAGFAAAMAVLVRPTNLIIFPTFFLLMPSWRALGLFVLGGLPGAAWLAAYQHLLYGSALRSGYGDVWELFRWSNLGPTLTHYGLWLSRFLPWLLLAGVAASWMALRGRRRVLLALAWWTLSVFGFYAFYDVTQETWWCLRFILPALPALILAGSLGVQSLGQRLGGERRWLLPILAIFLAVSGGWAARHWGQTLAVTGGARTEPAYRETAEWAAANLPHGAVVVSMFASGAVYYYTDFAVLRWDTISREEFERFVAAADLHARPIYALMFAEEYDSARERTLSGSWTHLYQVDRMAVWKLNGLSAPAAQTENSGVRG